VRPKKDAVATQPSSLWTEGAKTVLIIRIDFPDKPGEPVDNWTGLPLTIQRAQDIITDVNPFFVSNSYGKTSFQSVTVTPVVRLTHNSNYYDEEHLSEMMTEARSAARTAGFETDDYNLDIIASVNTGIPFAGLGAIGGKGLLALGYFNSGVFSHELGHNYGLSHANLWRTVDNTVIGQGNDVDGGDFYDKMGGGEDFRFHFNARYKRYLDWLTDKNVQTVSESGVYRVFAHDSTVPAGIRVLKIRKDNTKNYWVEFRQLITGNPNIMNGATIRWEKPNFNQTQLLDMTPGTNSSSDAPLLIGQSFLDEGSRVKITILGKGATTPESLDVQVDFNVGCTFSIGQTSQNFSAAGGEGAITVNMQSGCSHSAESFDEWVTPGFVEDDAGIIKQYYVVAANYTSQPRTGTLNVGGQTFIVHQSAAAETSCFPSPAGLVAWWRGEGNALDQTGVNHGTLVNGISFRGGKIGGGFYSNTRPQYNYESGRFVSIPDSPSLALTESMTFEGWIKINAATGGTLTGGTIIERTTDVNSFGSYRVSATGKLGFTIFHNNEQSSGITSFNNIPLNEFVHFAATRDDATGQLRLYMNGIMVGERIDGRRPNSLTRAVIRVGNLNGVTDELSVYNRALSQSEIKAIYNAGMTEADAVGKCLSVTNNANRPKFDFDGDGKSDFSIYRPEAGEWWYLKSSDSSNVAAQFGTASDKVVPADYTGDGKADFAFYRPEKGEWYVLRSEDFSYYAFPFGLAEDVPVPADYDGDGRADAAVFRPSTNVWYVLKSTGGVTIQQYGSSGDAPVPADYNGDGITDLAVYNSSTGSWRVKYDFGGLELSVFRANANKPVPADYTGDGKADIALYDTVTNDWFIVRSENQSSYTTKFGVAGDIPTPADYDGDGKTDVAIYRPSTRDWWYAASSAAGQQRARQFGISTDLPLPSSFVR
jgi:hypothetical protein